MFNIPDYFRRLKYIVYINLKINLITYKKKEREKAREKKRYNIVWKDNIAYTIHRIIMFVH